MTLSRSWLIAHCGPLLEPLVKAEAVPVHVGPPPTPNRADYPYQGTVIFQGIPIYVENLKGSKRSGVDPDGKPWSVVMPAHYGEFVGTRGMDGDPIDVFVGPDAAAPVAYVVHQKVPGSQRMDEDKVVVGCRSAEEAEALYRSAYTTRGFFAGVTPWPVDELREELRNRRAWGRRLDTPGWLRAELAKGDDETPDESTRTGPPGRGIPEREVRRAAERARTGAKPEHREEPGPLSEADEAILDRVWERVARERAVGRAAEGHEAARRASVDLEKAVQIRNRPGLALRPSASNPRIRRWVRTSEDQSAEKPAAAAAPAGDPRARGRTLAVQAPRDPERPPVTTPQTREAVERLWAGVKTASGKPPTDHELMALTGLDPDGVCQVYARYNRVVLYGWVPGQPSPYDRTTMRIRLDGGDPYEIVAHGHGRFSLYAMDYAADSPSDGEDDDQDPNDEWRRGSKMSTGEWNLSDEGIKWANEDAIPRGIQAEIRRKVDRKLSANLTRIVNTDDRGGVQVYNALFVLPNEQQGGGRGAEALARQVDVATRLGVSLIHCTAARSEPASDGRQFVGYYVWARLGYDAPLKDYSGEWNTRGSIEPPDADTVETMHDLMASPEGRDFWKEHGDTWDAEFDPSPGSRHRAILSAYLEEKGSRVKLAKAVPIKGRSGLVLRASPKAPNVKRWQRVTVDSKKHDAWWRGYLDHMVRPPVTRTFKHPRTGEEVTYTSKYEQADADRDYARFTGDGARNMRRLSGTVLQAIRRLGPAWPGVRVHIDQPEPSEKSEDIKATGHAFVRLGSGPDAPSFMLAPPLKGTTAPYVDDVLEAGDRDSFPDPNVETAYFQLIEAIRNPNKAKSSRVVTLYTARPVADRAMYEDATEVPHGVFLTTDPDRAHGLAHDLSGGKADRDVYMVRVRERDLVQTLSSGRIRDYQVIGRPGRKVPVVSMERLEKGLRLAELLKATIRTPKGADGKVDYDAVPVGSSIWVTVTDPSSPLHGRPILISKRPDKTFALIGGSGAKHIQARRHLVMQGGEIRGSQVDEARAAARKEIAERNAPKVAALKELRRKARTEQRASEKAFMEALGIKRRGLSDEDRDAVRRAAEVHAREQFGLDDEAAASFAKHLSTGIAKKEEERVKKETARRLETARLVVGGMSLDDAEELAGPAPAPVTLSATLPDGFAGMTEPEREAAVLGALDEGEALAHLQAAEDSRFEPEPGPEPEPPAQPPETTGTPVDVTGSSEGARPAELGAGGDPNAHGEPSTVEPEPVPGLDEPQPQGDPLITAGEPPPAADAFTFTLGAPTEPSEPAAPPVRALASVDAARTAIDRFREYAGIQKSAKEIADSIEELPEAELAAPSAVDELRLRADAVSDEEVDRYLAQYRERAMAPPDAGFYDALTPHWNEIEGNKLNGAVVNGAGSAISAIVGDEIAARYDVRRLVDALGPEAASIAVVQRMREEMTPEAFKAFRDKLEESNTTGLRETETRALARHRELQKQAHDLEAQVSSGDLQSRATIAMLRARNLMEQRENLGGALGSMQASASMFHFADVASAGKGYKKRHEVKINVGPSRLALDDKLKRLGGFKRKIEYDVNTGGYSIVTDTASLRKFVTRTEANAADAERWRGVKNSADNIERDEEGREWAAGYQVPGFRSHFGNVETLPPDQKHLAGQRIRMLAEQRNNIEWLHGAGGGLVTMRTGGGKTVVSAAVAAKMLHENPKGRHLRIVPDGREEQWAAEISNFTVHKPHVIPAKATKEERHQAIAAAPEGSIVIIGHSPAGKHDYNALGVHAWDSIGIDEPQELRAKSGSGKLSSGAKRIFKLEAPHRHALTATPATDNPVEAYDIVNWTRPGVLGFRSRFASSFSGFGGGTNAQDEAMTRMLYRELEPHVSGERVVPPHYGIHHNDVQVTMTDGQKARQQEIEAGVEEHVQRRIDEAYEKKRQGVRGYAETSFAALRAKASEKAMSEMEARHRANLGGGDHADNAKLRALAAQLDKAGKDDRHVIFVDSADQRRSVTELLKARGVAPSDVRNITSAAKNATVVRDGQVMGAIEERKRAWKGSKGGYLLIDQSSASGHNLAEGDHLHVLGNPDDAAQLLQVHGRLGRANRVGDFAIHTYKYQDSPFEHHKWNRLHRQLKVLKATAPGMFVEGARTTNTTTRLDKAVATLRSLVPRWLRRSR